MNRIFASICLFIILLQTNFTHPAAQDESENQPVNLSHSGTASQPRLVVHPDGRMQVFWVDRFDGILSTVFDDQAWSEPKPAELSVKNSTGMPEAFLLTNELVLAFWMEPETGNETGSILKYSQMLFGSRRWDPPQTLARNVVAFDANVITNGLLVAYIQGQHQASAQAGVYIRLSTGAITAFQLPKNLAASPYFRSLSKDQAYIQAVHDPQTGKIFLNWPDQRSGSAVFVSSVDLGTSWSAPMTVDPPSSGDRFSRPRLLFSNKTRSLLLVWKTGQYASCAAFEQSADADLPEISFFKAQAINQALPVCPQGDRLWSHSDGPVWVWGEGTDQLVVLRQEAPFKRWSSPRIFTYTVQEPGLSAPQALNGIHAVLLGSRLMVVGHGADLQDIWFSSTPLPVSSLTETEITPWVETERVVIGDNLVTESAIDDLAAVVDSQAQTHVVFSRTTGYSGRGASLYYLQSVEGKTNRFVEISKPEDGNFYPHLALALESRSEEPGDLLHLVWTNGQNGAILYSHALTKEALSPGSWSTPVFIDEPSFASATWPQLLVGPARRLYLLYAVPLNENRGIYLAYSEDSGKSWARPIQVFDAAKAGWQMADHPTLGYTPDGVLIAAWVRRPLPGLGQPNGIFYARSMDGGKSWGEALPAAGAGYDWPVLASTQNQVNLFYMQPATGSMFQQFFSLPSTSAESTLHWSVAYNILKERVLMDSTYPPYHVTASRDSLYLTGIRQDRTSQFFSTWTGGPSNEARWTTGEIMVISNETERQTQSIAQSSLAVLSSSGSMAIVFLETTTVKGSKEDKPQLDMVFTTRTIPIEDGIQIETFPQTQVTSAGAEPPDWPVATAVSNDQAPTGHQTTDQGPKVPAITLEQASDILPTLHASMNRTPEEVGLPILPPILGIIVASISVAVILTFRALRRNSHV